MRYKQTLSVVLVSLSSGPTLAAAPVGRGHDVPPVARLVAEARERARSRSDEASGSPGLRGGRIDLAALDKAALQRVMDALASDPCSPSTRVSCRWRVISLETGSASVAVDDPPDESPSAQDPPGGGTPTEDEPVTRRPGRFSTRVPAGFEALAARRRTEVDVYARNTLALRTPISHDSATFVFDDPFAVTEAVALVGLPDRIAFEDFVGLDHPLDAADLCIDDGPRDCLTGEPAGYAFVPDLGARRVDLLVRDRPRTAASDAPLRLPPASRGIGLQADARAAAVAITSQGAAVDARVDGSAGYGAGALFASTSYGSTDDVLRLNDAFLQHQYPDHLLRLGTLDYLSDGLLLNQRLLGASWARSLNTYVDRRSLYTSPIELFLERRAVVQLVVDGVGAK